MPTKFRKNVWIKRGDFVMVQPIEEGDKVKAEISHILVDKHHIKHIKQVRGRLALEKIVKIYWVIIINFCTFRPKNGRFLENS
jgi:hypothetical protein